jgi:purine-binding chemotaxis protein CheW
VNVEVAAAPAPAPATDATQPDLAGQLAGKYMTFKLGDGEYGLSILRVREIIGLMDITPIPRSRNYVRGVINLRGKVIPVLDLRLKFGMPASEATEQTVIIVVQYAVRDRYLTMGILVDQVLEVLNITAPQIEPPPAAGTGLGETDFILGVGKSERRVIFLLDIGRVLGEQESMEVLTAA